MAITWTLTLFLSLLPTLRSDPLRSLSSRPTVYILLSKIFTIYQFFFRLCCVSLAWPEQWAKLLNTAPTVSSGNCCRDMCRNMCKINTEGRQRTLYVSLCMTDVQLPLPRCHNVAVEIHKIHNKNSCHTKKIEQKSFFFCKATTPFAKLTSSWAYRCFKCWTHKSAIIDTNSLVYLYRTRSACVVISLHHNNVLLKHCSAPTPFVSLLCSDNASAHPISYPANINQHYLSRNFFTIKTHSVQIERVSVQQLLFPDSIHHCIKIQGWICSQESEGATKLPFISVSQLISPWICNFGHSWPSIPSYLSVRLWTGGYITL